MGVYPLKGRDALYVRWNGGGGYGDPLERDPARVAADVAAGLVSPEAARGIYGVVLAGDGAADEVATATERTRMKAERLTPEAAE